MRKRGRNRSKGYKSMKNNLWFVFILLCGAFFLIVASSIIDKFKPKKKIKKVSTNIIGTGPAKGIYLVESAGVYIVSGRTIKNKKKAVGELMELIEENGLTPPDEYFKMIKINDEKEV